MCSRLYLVGKTKKNSIYNPSQLDKLEVEAREAQGENFSVGDLLVNVAFS